MNNFFEREVLSLERELLWLKTCAQRSSGVVETVTKTVAVSVPLSMNTQQTSCSGVVYYVVEPESTAIIIPTLDWYCSGSNWDVGRTPSIVRTAGVVERTLGNGRRRIAVSVSGTNFSTDASDDLSRLRRGETVSVSVNLTVRASDNFTIGVYNG